jgi:hypothetical protein
MFIQAIKSRISVVWDGWSTRNRRPFTSVTIVYIHSPSDNDNLWTLKKHLIEFNSTVGRHTGEMIGNDLVTSIRRFRIEAKVRVPAQARTHLISVLQLGWMVGDGVSANDVAVRQVCKVLDPEKSYLNPKQVRIL